MSDTDEKTSTASSFIRKIIDEDLASGKHREIVTRFPPEPNGYLHAGHPKAIALNFDIARDYGGRCYLRFDDTNPITESDEYVRAIQEDIRWLGFDWGDRLTFASDYFDPMYAYAVQLIERGKAFVCDLSSEEIEARRGTLTEPGDPSPYRDRSVEENLDLFARMKAGEFAPGERVLRGRIDMASSVLPMRDPVFYRIVDGSHHRTGDAWHVYPLYDFAHCLEDAIEGVTHSLCTLEFADHRPLYDWILENVDAPSRPRQIEFARGNLTHTVMSKRYLKQLVEEGHVAGWDDPRMPTVAALRRRGYTPESIRRFWEGAGVARRENTLQLAQLEAAIREDLNERAPRALAVLDPLKLVIENYPEDQVEELEAINNPQDPDQGTRLVPFSRELYIEREDFALDPPRKFHRLAPGREVRLRYAYLVTCTEVVQDDAGNVTEVRCQYDPATRGGDAPDGRKVKGTIHWVSAARAARAEVRLYDVLFREEDPDPAADFEGSLNPDSLEVRRDCPVEPALAEAAVGSRFQFERLGYFCVDRDARPGTPVFNRTVTLRDTWAKIARKS